MAKQNGFTLVELAIVLMIIGLLIGGILRGQELIQNAENAATISQVKSYEGATHTFSDQYNGLPGDLLLASARIPSCQTGNNNGCINGNGDGIIGVLNPGQGTYANEPWQGIDTNIPSENTQYWKHLALAHLITSVNPSAATPEWGKSQPIAKTGGGFSLRYVNMASGSFFNWTGHILVIRKVITPFSSSTDGTSPKRASLIDRKIDDGVSVTGDVRALGGEWNNGCVSPNTNGAGPSGYIEGREDNVCLLFFKIF